MDSAVYRLPLLKGNLKVPRQDLPEAFTLEGRYHSGYTVMTLPSLALVYGGENGWRYAVATTGCIAMVYGIIFFLRARNTPKGSTYFKP